MACTEGTWIICKTGCKYCDELERLMTRDKITFEKLVVTVSREDSTKFFVELLPSDPMMSAKWAAKRTYPLWFQDGVYMGGCDDYKRHQVRVTESDDEDF